MSKKKKDAKQKPQEFKLKIEQVVLLAVLALVFLLIPKENLFASTNPEIQEKPEVKISRDFIKDIKPSSYPVKKSGVVEPYLTAKSAMAIDVPSGTVLYKKDENLPLWPASTTKLMTALVALDYFSLDSVLTVENPIKEGRIMELVPGEKITMENILYGLLIHSANDAAFTIARNYPGGEEMFVAAMNDKARDLNLDNTHFADPAGFDDNKQYSTAQDLMRLSIYAMKNQTIAKVVSIPAITIHDVDDVYFHNLTNVNKLLGVVPGVAGVKTGWTENAKENLINLTKRDGREVMTVVLGSDDRFGETQVLTNWAFDNFEWKDFSYPPKQDQ